MEGGFKFSSTGILCLVAAVLLQKSVTVSAVYSMAQTCPHMSSGFVADPNDCTRYGFCNNSVLVGTSQCDKGLVYNTRKAVCESPSAGVCSVGNVCQYAADRSFVANPNDCSSYYYCSQGSGTLVACPRGQVFDPQLNQCSWKSTTPCSTSSICRLVPDGTFVGDPEICGNYVNCNNGLGTSSPCQSGLYYNKALGGCQATNPCNTPAVAGVGPGVATPLADDPDVCKSQKTFPAYVSDEQTCMGYFVCTTETGPGAWRKCNPGLHFYKGDCVSPISYACPYDRCGNVKQEFVGALNSDCKNYIVCANETAQPIDDTEGTACPAANPYFDEYKMACVDKSPAVANKYVLCPAS